MSKVRICRVLVFLIGVACWSQSANAMQFLTFPLSTSLYPSGAYTAGKIISVLDHYMVPNDAGKYQYGKVSDGGGNGIIVGFTGETASGARLSDVTCVQGSVALWGMVIPGAGCGNTNYVSYDEHPGYDYRANYNTPVYAAFSGRVVNGPTGMCVMTSTVGASCASWGMVGIDHSLSLPPFIPQPYITQYEHMRNDISISGVYPGAYVVQGQLIGYTSNTAPVSLGYHFHFEVLQRKSNAPNNYSYLNYLVIDPYGWSGSYPDPLYSYANFGIVQTRLWQ